MVQYVASTLELVSIFAYYSLYHPLLVQSVVAVSCHRTCSVGRWLFSDRLIPYRSGAEAPFSQLCISTCPFLAYCLWKMLIVGFFHDSGLLCANSFPLTKRFWNFLFPFHWQFLSTLEYVILVYYFSGLFINFFFIPILLHCSCYPLRNLLISLF